MEGVQHVPKPGEEPSVRIAVDVAGVDLDMWDNRVPGSVPPPSTQLAIFLRLLQMVWK